MIPLFAQAAEGSINWNAITALGMVLGLIVNGILAIRMLTGKDSERQIEPTALHAVVSELKDQTKTLGDIKVDVGVTKAKIETVEKSVDGFHQRVGGISRELAATTARVDGLEQRETQ